jgi:hypothetical protein
VAELRIATNVIDGAGASKTRDRDRPAPRKGPQATNPTLAGRSLDAAFPWLDRFFALINYTGEGRRLPAVLLFAAKSLAANARLTWP